MTSQEKLDMLAAQLDIAGNALLTARKLLREMHGEQEQPRDTGPRAMGRNAKPFAGTPRDMPIPEDPDMEGLSP